MIKVKDRIKGDLTDRVELQFVETSFPVIICPNCGQEFILFATDGRKYYVCQGINLHLLHCPYCGKMMVKDETQR